MRNETKTSDEVQLISLNKNETNENKNYTLENKQKSKNKTISSVHKSIFDFTNKNSNSINYLKQK